jgi:hypothetical protein
MLHLLPIRILLTAFAFVIGTTIALVVAAGWTGVDDLTEIFTTMLRYAAMASTAMCLIVLLAWRWIPLVQGWIFPYLGGKWDGTLQFGLDGVLQKEVTLEITHTLFKVRLLLESDESRSKTIVVHAKKDPDFERYQIYYVYRNERKEGVQGAGSVYRGLSIMRVERLDGRLEMSGDYFTETHRQGTMRLSCVQPNPFWKFWK